MTTTPSPVYGGRYELQHLIARGGTAQVYLARDLLLDRPVALKVLFPELSSDHSFVERFRREAQAAANLSHPNIVPVFDWGESDSTYFIVMEYVDGEPLSSIIRTQAPLAPIQAASITADIAKALSYAHRHGVVHRDVKPGNVLITADGQVKVTDFGIARAIGADEQVTQTGIVMGTATYFSPEQAQGLEVDGRSDVYSLGVVLYEMVTGRPPFSGETPVSIAYQHVREEPPTPRSVAPTLPASLEAIILQAMAKLPAARYRSAEELRADLERFVHGQVVLAAPPGTATGPVTQVVSRAEPVTGVHPVVTDDEPRVRRTTGRWLAAGGVLVVLLGVLVGVGGRSLGWFGGAPYVRIPDIVGMPRARAIAALDEKGFGHVVRTVAGTASTTGRVTRTDPSYPGTLRRGDTVTVYVAGAAPSQQIPTLTTLTLAEARIQLKNSGFAKQPAVTYVKAQNATQPQGTVIEQYPPPGASSPTDTVVQLKVVKGTKLVTVPNLAGQNLAAAGAALANAGLNLNNQAQVNSATVPVGDVVRTQPAAGKRVPAGTPVDLYVSKGGALVPNLANDALALAEQTLTSLGLGYRVAPVVAPTPDLIGFVVNQVPKPGTPVGLNYQVTIFVGTGSTSTTTLPAASSTSTTTTTTPPGTVPGN